MAFERPFSSTFELATQIGLSDLFSSPTVFGTFGNDTLDQSGPVSLLFSLSGDDEVTLASFGYSVNLGFGNDTLVANGPVVRINAGFGNDVVTLNDFAGAVDLGRGHDTLNASAFVLEIDTGAGRDTLNLETAGEVSLGGGADTLTATGYVEEIDAGRGRDTVTLEGGGGIVDLGRGHDSLTLNELVEDADGGRGQDELIFTFEAGNVDVAFSDGDILFVDRFSGQEMTATGFETVTFSDRSFNLDELEEFFGEDAIPYIQVGGGTQVVTVNNVDPTISVIWDRVVQQAVIEASEVAVGPTVAARAYAMMHTAMYDAWSAYDATATYVSLDAEGDNVETTGTDADKEKAMSYAALTVLREVFPEAEELYVEVMQDRLGFSMTDDGSEAAMIGIDAAEDLLLLRNTDGSNQSGNYADTTGYTPVNPGPGQINDITRWTSENVPVDPEGETGDQEFLTPQWERVEGFALEENPDGTTKFSATLPPAPQPFFTPEFADATLNFAAKTITLGSDATIGGDDFLAGDTIDVSKDLIGEVINEGFITQAQEVIDFSANLTDEQKIIAEFWEDGGGTAFPPGTSLVFAQFASARDGNTIDDDAKLFMMMGNAVSDAGIATWQAKVEYDYVRPVRAIRDLGELGLIGEMGTDENTGQEGFVIEAFGGFNEDGTGRGTQTILAENFVTFQLPGGNVSPPFAEYTSGHSGFSAAGATILEMFTGSEEFGGSVTFAPDSIIFEEGVPEAETTLEWATFRDAADEAGLSRLYGGIHFNEGDINGRILGNTVAEDVYDVAQLFFDGSAMDADRPFFV